MRAACVPHVACGFQREARRTSLSGRCVELKRLADVLRRGLRVPYPVPFRLLGKEAQGFLDTEYLGESVRVSVGNKGTTFILERMQPATPTA